jgi:hypothetical protein
MRPESSHPLACLAAGVLVSASAAHASDCIDVPKAAAIAQVKVPHSVQHVMTLPGKAPERADMIFAGDKAYMKVDGKWSSIPFSAKDQVDMINSSSAKGQVVTCQKTAGETIAGEPTFLMTVHESAPKVNDVRFWISTRTGLPMRDEIRLGDGLLISDEFRYDNIQAPAGVK